MVPLEGLGGKVMDLVEKRAGEEPYNAKTLTLHTVDPDLIKDVDFWKQLGDTRPLDGIVTGEWSVNAHSYQ